MMRWACLAVAAHAAAVCLCGAFAYIDGRGIFPPPGSPAALALRVGVYASFFAWFVCPVVVLAQAIRRPSWPVAASCTAEVMLSYSQYLLLLPTVQ